MRPAEGRSVSPGSVGTRTSPAGHGSLSSVRLELLGTLPYRELGTPQPASGVDGPSPVAAGGDLEAGIPAVASPAREGTRLGWRGWFTVLAFSCTLLGQGERCRVERTYR